MSITLTVVIATEDESRLEAALAASGIADPAQLVADRINQIVHDYEASHVGQAAWQQYADAIEAGMAAIVPVTPTVTETVEP